MKFSHKFVKNIPDQIEEGIIYVSVEYATAIHKCPSGCGAEVVTPISPTDWELTFNGNSISLSPSIGNWNFECQSHYWIEKNQIIWASKWTKQQIEDGRNKDMQGKKFFYHSERKNFLLTFFQRNKYFNRFLRIWSGNHLKDEKNN